MNADELNKRIEEVDPARLDSYQRMFDRILLFNLAVAILPPEQIDRTINWVDTIVKKTIDLDSTRRTDFLQKTKEGRLERLAGQPDGEDIRLNFLKTWTLAKDIISANLHRNDETPDI